MVTSPSPLTDPPAATASPGAVADYAAHMAGALADLCRNAELELLAYLLDVARAEALTQVNAMTVLGQVRREG